MRIPAHIIRDRMRREERRKRRDDMARIPWERPGAPGKPKSRNDRPKGEKKRPVVISIKF